MRRREPAHLGLARGIANDPLGHVSANGGGDYRYNDVTKVLLALRAHIPWSIRVSFRSPSGWPCGGGVLLRNFKPRQALSATI
jgi:hypothetical protein